MSVVLDNSVIIDWLLEPKANLAVDELIERHRNAFIVPSLYWSELVYVLGKYERRGRITSDFRSLCIRRAIALNVESDLEAAAPGAAFDRALELINRYGLTIYDAIYLELAQRRGGALATLDADLAGAAKAAGLDVLPA